MATRTKILLLLWVLIAIAVTMTAAIARERPVLLNIVPEPAMVRPRNICIMNPFRDRSPERPARALLRELRAGNVAVLDELAPSLREEEKKYPIRSWRVGRREHHADTTELMYWVRRGNYYDGEEEVHLTVRGKGNAARVVEYGAIY